MLVSFLAKIIALLLLALWVPATFHCDLEAAGFLQDSVQTDSCCQTADEICADETCRDFNRSIQILAPNRVQVALFQWSIVLPELLSLSSLAPAAPLFKHGDTPAIQVLTRTWSFVRRSALPARAPAFVA